jgi:C1A family cysteine protease
MAVCRTRHTRLHREEQTPVVSDRRGYGWMPDLPDARDYRFNPAEHTQLHAALPAKVDLRARCPSIYDQLQLGACTGNAIAGAVQFDRRQQKLPDWTPSRLFIYYEERRMEGTISSDSGAMIRDGIKSVNKVGAPPESDWPYNIRKYKSKPSLKAYSDAAKHKAVIYRRINRLLSDMQSCLAAGLPFVFGFTVYDSFESDEVANTGVVNMPDLKIESVLGGHAVLAVGYDLSSGRFIVRNSWGTGWGLDGSGYFTMPFDYLLDSDLSDDMWVVQSVK